MKNKSLLGLKRGSEKLPLSHEIGPNYPSGFTCIGASKCKCTVPVSYTHLRAHET